MKIGIVTETYWPDINGVAMTLNRLVSGLLDKGHQIQLICPQHKNRELDKFPQNLNYQPVKGFPIPRYKEASFGLPSKSILKKCWLKEKPDIIYVATEGPLGWSAVKLANKLNIPVISGFHTNFHSYSNYYQIGFLEKKEGKQKKFDPISYYFEEIPEGDYQLIKDDSSFKFISIEHLNSRVSEELQAVDLIAGSIFQKLEHNNSEYYNILFHNKSKVKINGIELIRKK